MFPQDVLPQVAVTLGAAAGIITALGIIWAKAVRPGCRKLQEAYEWVKDLLKLLNYQLRPNSGHSIVDIVKRLDTVVSEVRCDQVKNKVLADDRHEETKGHLTKLDERMDVVEKRLPEGER